MQAEGTARVNVWEHPKNGKELVKTQVILIIGRKDMCVGAWIGNEA